MASILVINGPNLNLLGSREPEIYGSFTLEDVNARLAKQCEAAGHEIQFLQSNSEAEIIDRIHAAKKEGVSFMILNPAALTHTSVALRDALLAVTIPFIEVHVSNVHAREEFRKHSFLSDIAVGSIVGLGTQGYDLALEAAITRIEANNR
jgi:3-dehydroquinate dehydratase-2